MTHPCLQYATDLTAFSKEVRWANLVKKYHNGNNLFIVTKVHMERVHNAWPQSSENIWVILLDDSYYQVTSRR